MLKNKINFMERWCVDTYLHSTLGTRSETDGAHLRHNFFVFHSFGGAAHERVVAVVSSGDTNTSHFSLRCHGCRFSVCVWVGGWACVFVQHESKIDINFT